MGRTSTGNPKGIVSLKRTSGSYVIGKIQVLKEHYERLGRASVDYQFDDSWRKSMKWKSIVRCLIHRAMRY